MKSHDQRLLFALLVVLWRAADDETFVSDSLDPTSEQRLVSGGKANKKDESKEKSAAVFMLSMNRSLDGHLSSSLCSFETTRDRPSEQTRETR